MTAVQIVTIMLQKSCLFVKVDAAQTLWSRISTPRILYLETCIRMFLAALFAITKQKVLESTCKHK